MKILMVCLGNICRSPMAEGIMQSKIEKYGLGVTVDSAGFEPFHSGDSPDLRAIAEMKRHGIDISHQSSRLFRESDFDEFDRIYVMDSKNYADVLSMSTDKKQMHKVDFILNAIFPGSNKPVPDPYYGGNDGFKHTFELLEEASEIIAQKLKQSIKK